VAGNACCGLFFVGQGEQNDGGYLSIRGYGPENNGKVVKIANRKGHKMTADELAAAVGNAAAHELDSALNRIKHCLGQLNEEQVWWRSRPSLNSIGNLILHLCGNVRQWIVSGVGGALDVRNRPAEFAERGPIPKDELVSRIDEVVAEAKRTLIGLAARQLVENRRIQGFDVSGLTAIFNSVPHFRGHVQEIIHITRLQLGDAYKVAWTPTTPEEGATN
jgi:hypothetical protein